MTAKRHGQVTTPQEQAPMGGASLPQTAAKLAPRMVKGERGGFSPDHPNKAHGYALLAKALGTADRDFLFGFLEQLAEAGSESREVDEEGFTNKSVI